MKRQFRLAHLSDIHLSPLVGARWRSLANKRVFGYINWQRNRHKVHKRDRLDVLLHDIKLHEPDHVVVTGDLVNLGLPEEFIAAQDWLEDLGTPDFVSVVPGNHDAYVKMRIDPGFERWRPYMTSNAGGQAISGGADARGFPFVKRYGDVALIGLSSAVPTMPFIAAGRLGKDQIAYVENILGDASCADLCKIIAIHHPPIVSRSNWYHGLKDAKAFGGLAKKYGMDLILHGHWHSQSTNFIDGRHGHIPIIGVPSASSGKVGHKPLARYNLYDFYHDKGVWSAHLTGRGFSSLDGAVHTIETSDVDLGFHGKRESEMIGA